jgi:hypothetical protein
MKPTTACLSLKCFFLLLTVQSNGQSVVLTLDNVPDSIQCNEVWTEQNVSLSFVSTTADDWAPDMCFFTTSPPDMGAELSVMVYPSRLTVDLSSLEGIEMVEVDIVDYCGFNCTKAFLMDNAGIVHFTWNSVSSVSETLTSDNLSQSTFAELAISGGETGINEIRIYQNTSSIMNASPGVKELSRIIDGLGREVNRATNQILFYIYDDGSVEKKFIIE